MTPPVNGTDVEDLVARFDLAEREGTSKVMSLAEAVARFVQPSSTVHVAYSDARPNAALLQLVRHFAGKGADLTLITAGLVNLQHSLVHTGVVSRVITSFAGENYPAARPNATFQAAVREGRVSVDNWSLWTLVARLIAGALGVPFLPVRSLAGSSIAAEHEGRTYATLSSPFDDRGPTGLVAALRPDVVVLQAVASDEAGNVVMSAPYGEGFWGSLAARVGVIACVERIASTAEIRSHSSLVRIPAHAVRAVCHVPFGSHPYGLYNPGFPGVTGYVEDAEFMAETFAASRNPETFAAWIDEWVLGTRDHDDYLHKLGASRQAELAAAAAHDSWVATADSTWLRDASVGWSESEVMVVAAARQIRRRVRDAGHQAVLAGVGQSNLAAWLATTGLKRDGHDVELMAEIGMFGYDPRPGEPFIFAHRNLPTCKMLTDVMSVLGTFVSGPGTRSLGVIGAGQVDRAGNANSTYTESGDFLVGSGGANDIATAADEVLVTVAHGRDRLVDRVPYVTCPGDRVRSIVTSAGVFERGDDGFVLTRYVPVDSGDSRAAVEEIRAMSSWEFSVARDLEPEPAPSAEELQAIRLYDPAGLFARSRRGGASASPVGGGA